MRRSILTSWRCIKPKPSRWERGKLCHSLDQWILRAAFSRYQILSSVSNSFWTAHLPSCCWKRRCAFLRLKCKSLVLIWLIKNTLSFSARAWIPRMEPPSSLKSWIHNSTMQRNLNAGVLLNLRLLWARNSEKVMKISAGLESVSLYSRIALTRTAWILSLR